MYTINDFVNYYCSNYQMSYKKLQSVLYYTYAWSIVLSEKHKPIFKAEFVAQTHGPRDLSLIELKHKFGYQYIQIEHPKTVQFDKDTTDLIEQIVNVYVKPYSGLKLDSLTQQETPWLNAKNGPNKKLSNQDMFEFYDNF